MRVQTRSSHLYFKLKRQSINEFNKLTFMYLVYRSYIANLGHYLNMV